MNRSSDPVLPRMPGSAIIAVVLLGLQALVGLGTGVALGSLIPQGLAVALFLGGMLNAVLALGVAGRKNWARMTGMVLSGIAVGASVLGLLIAAAEGAPIGNPGAIGISIALLFLLSHKNTRAWCGDPESARFGSVAPEFEYRDRVELLNDLDEVGLRAGAVGSVIGLPSDPGTLLVEFDDHPDREPIEVVLHFSEIRRVTAVE
jgi:hypothetical protein